MMNKIRPIKACEIDHWSEMNVMSILNTNRKSGVNRTTWKIDWIIWRRPFKNDRPTDCKKEHEILNRNINGEDENVIRTREKQWLSMFSGHFINFNKGYIRNCKNGNDKIRNIIPNLVTSVKNWTASFFRLSPINLPNLVEIAVEKYVIIIITADEQKLLKPWSWTGLIGLLCENLLVKKNNSTKSITFVITNITRGPKLIETKVTNAECFWNLALLWSTE